MEKLDFRSFIQKTWEVVLCDEAGTTLHLTAPTEELIERLSANMQTLTKVFETRDPNMIASAYDLAAEFISCNTEKLQVTGEELRTKYGFKLVFMAAFFKQYLDFVNEINDAKN